MSFIESRIRERIKKGQRRTSKLSTSRLHEDPKTSMQHSHNVTAVSVSDSDICCIPPGLYAFIEESYDRPGGPTDLHDETLWICFDDSHFTP